MELDDELPARWFDRVKRVVCQRMLFRVQVNNQVDIKIFFMFIGSRLSTFSHPGQPFGLGALFLVHFSSLDESVPFLFFLSFGPLSRSSKHLSLDVPVV